METLFLRSIKDAIKHWYIPLLVGIFFIVVSVVSFTSPLSSLLTLAILFSVSFTFGGVSEIIFAISNRKQLENWGWSLALGILTLVIGLLLMLNPILSMATLAFYVGFVIFFRSISAIGFAVDLKKYGVDKWWILLILGILGTVFSFLLIWNPLFAGMSIVVLISLSFLFGGLLSVYLSLQMRKLHRSTKDISAKLRERFEELAKDIREEWDD